jgi:curved DNA-binding protein CbpA
MINFKSLILEKLGASDAEAIFSKFGVPNALSLSKGELKKQYKDLVLKHHPDKGGIDKDMRVINAAYDILKLGGGRGHYRSVNTSGGDKDNLNNIDNVKRKAYEISGNPPMDADHEYTIWNFDGHYFRGVFTVFAVPEKLFEISRMMQIWDSTFNSVAVFFTQRKYPSKVFLINHKGVEVAPPKGFEHDSFNQNPGNDSAFVNHLRKSL